MAIIMEDLVASLLVIVSLFQQFTDKLNFAKNQSTLGHGFRVTFVEYRIADTLRYTAGAPIAAIASDTNAHVRLVND